MPDHASQGPATEPRRSTSTLDGSIRAIAWQLIHFAVPLAVLVLAGFAAWGLANMKEPPKRIEQGLDVPLVETATVAANDQGLDIEVDGVVVPYREIRLSAQVAGRIQWKSEDCNEGNYVTKETLTQDPETGEPRMVKTPLLQIDPRDYELEVERLEQELAQAENAVREQDVTIENTDALRRLSVKELDLQDAEVERVRKLFQIDKVLPESEYDSAKRLRVVAETAVVRLENELLLQREVKKRLEIARERVRVQLKKARLDLSRTDVYMPVDGVILSDDIEEGWYVNIGTPLVAIEDTSKVEVRCQLRVEELYWLWRQKNPAGPEKHIGLHYQVPPTAVTVIYELAGRKFKWRGTLTRFDGIGFDEDTRTVPCRVLVENPLYTSDAEATAGAGAVGPPALVRGMYVTVQVHSTPDATLVRVPETAIQPNNTVYCVEPSPPKEIDKVFDWVEAFLVTEFNAVEAPVEDGRISIQKVHVVEIVDSVAVIQADDGALRPGDRVVTSPLPFARSGMQVETRESAAPPSRESEAANTASAASNSDRPPSAEA